mmetsp:Transcript_34304/g.73079  ORF Transcript_34304/g.73079 Transcript_34304/m.73079 type:complete len:231 (+) Transcript_34304:1542-2234(+)
MHVAVRHVCRHQFLHGKAPQARHGSQQVRDQPPFRDAHTDLHRMVVQSRDRGGRHHDASDPTKVVFWQWDWKEAERVKSRIFVAANLADGHGFELAREAGGHDGLLAAAVRRPKVASHLRVGALLGVLQLDVGLLRSPVDIIAQTCQEDGKELLSIMLSETSEKGLEVPENAHEASRRYHPGARVLVLRDLRQELRKGHGELAAHAPATAKVHVLQVALLEVVRKERRIQ